MKKIYDFMLVFFCLLAMAACGQESQESENVYQIYYVSNSETKVEMHGHVMQADTTEGQLQELLECLSTNPEKLEYKAPLGMGFQVLDMKLEEGNLQIDVDAAYKELPVMTEVLVRAAVVRTLTQLQDINLVMITVEGNQLYDKNGNTISWMSAEQFIDNDGNEINTYELARVRLYFAGESGTNLIAAVREKHYSTNVLMERFVVEELIAGPSGQIEGLYPSINPGTKIVNVMTKDGVCYVNLDENWGTTQFMDSQENGIYDCISPELVEMMQDADFMCLNNEFTYSTRGAPLPGKAYTFRALPERVEVLHQLGVDAVTLANNHVYDYGPDALMDTFAVLEEAKIPYFGAGRTLEDAMEPLYLEIDGKVVALAAASRAEKNKMTLQATETEPGILRCYDTELFLQVIREAKEHADFCIAFVHWGTEYSFELEQVQRDTGKAYLDAGADVVIGAHSHCLQGMEYYNGKPIIYSLGNYWFNEKTLDTMLLQLHFSGTETETDLTVQVIPAVQAGYRTTYAGEPAEQRRIYDFLEEISVNVKISDEGGVTEAEQDMTGGG